MRCGSKLALYYHLMMLILCWLSNLDSEVLEPWCIKSFGERKEKSTGIQVDFEPRMTFQLPVGLSYWTNSRGAEAGLHITARLEASANSSCLSLQLICHCRIHCLVFKWRSPADEVIGLGWIDCTGTLPEWMLALGYLCRPVNVYICPWRRLPHDGHNN